MTRVEPRILDCGARSLLAIPTPGPTLYMSCGRLFSCAHLFSFQATGHVGRILQFVTRQRQITAKQQKLPRREVCVRVLPVTIKQNVITTYKSINSPGCLLLCISVALPRESCRIGPQTGYEAHPTSYPTGNGSSSSGS
jgi:hypothetical protein